MSSAKSTEIMEQHSHSSEIMLNNNNEIEEVDDSIETFDDDEIEQAAESCVYVAVGKSNTSMEALSWTLTNLFPITHSTNNTILYLIHVFPEIKHIPNPLGVGMVPRNQVSVEQVESYMEQEKDKRRQLLHKFLQSCSLSKVKVDTILIESDFVAKAILDLIPILQINNLIIGANKSHLIRKSKSKKGSGGVGDQVLKSAPESCKVRIICEGKEVNEQMMLSSPSPQIFTATNDDTFVNTKENDSVLCCFKPKFK
ncbi:putative aminoacyltransferase, E1 ubiquitin-activating enzyme [Medicago truncatula]|uniref:Putative aminoacyltransferase, E1 ubiquitin-activating enzyme n=1 Tax=Medicago truncatula TaxID=3880 RepID=G7ZZT8_MEDTR|nr:U-box domain-containing protein 35 isoform X1 [Medicago truncatula]KEH32699.1 universal stress family protein [Medicago truncatula]RHN65116.1 putative aminoacyltransferase, E1 ubiquitin-activating enzyme [Medicago truncatula]